MRLDTRIGHGSARERRAAVDAVSRRSFASEGAFMSTVRQMLRTKPAEVWTIAPEASVYDALQMMADKDIGAVLVVEGGRLVGVFSERDYARKVVLHGKSSRSTTVGELMTQVVFYVRPEQTIEECLALMTEKHIRHLPVLENERLIGIVTIGDVGKEIMSQQEFTIRNLETYITGGVSSRKPMTT
jgi:CBS domain-containing protein